jgi:hypothetical protein
VPVTARFSGHVIPHIKNGMKGHFTATEDNDFLVKLPAAGPRTKAFPTCNPLLYSIVQTVSALSTCYVPGEGS